MRETGRPAAQTRAGRRALLAQLSAPTRQFLRTEAGSAGILLLATATALAWANSPWSAAYESLWATEAGIRVGGATLAMDLEHWVNDGAMALFFFVVGLEVRREFSIGELTDPRRAAIPVAAALGGLMVPALIFLALTPDARAAEGWGVVIGTDTAFMLGALAVVGPTFATQLRIFLLTVTVIDDIVAVSVIGIFYSRSLSVPFLFVMAVLGALLALLSRLRVWQATPYVLLTLALWVATVESGLHASIAGMVAGLLVAGSTPRREAVEGAAARFRAFRQSPLVDVGRSARQGLDRSISVNERLQAVLHPWASYVVVPVFAFANAGIDLRGGVLAESLSSRLTWAVVIGLALGKPLGIGLTTVLGVRLGLGRLPQGVRNGHVFGGAALSGIGFTVSLLIAGLAFADEQRHDEAVVGVLVGAVLATLLGWLVFHAVALLRGEGDADLPRFLDREVQVGVDHVRGSADAPFTLVEYADFECPFCARATGALNELRQRLGIELRYVFRHLPLTDVHPHAELAARAAVAADRQGRFWEMHDVLFARQDQLGLEDVVGYAADLDLDIERFIRDLRDEETAERIRGDVASAEASGARGTPTFFVNGRRHVGPYDAQTLAEALESSAPSDWGRS